MARAVLSDPRPRADSAAMLPPVQAVPRWVRAVVVAAVVAVVGGGTTYYVALRESVRAAAEAQLTAVARLKVERIRAWRAERLADATVLTQGASFAEDLRRYLAAPDKELADRIRGTLRVVATSYDYADAILVDAQGVVSLALKEPAERLAGSREAARAALSAGAPILVELAAAPSWKLAVAAPLRSSGGAAAGASGVLLMVVDAERVLHPMLNAWPTPARTAESFLIRQDGDALLVLSNARFLPDAAQRLRIPLSQTDAPAVRTVRGETGSSWGVDYRNQAVVWAGIPVPETPWFLVAKQDEAEVLQPWRQQAALLAALVAVLGVTIVGSTILVLNLWRTKHLQQLLEMQRAAAEVLRESEEKFRTIFEDHSAVKLLIEPGSGRIVEANGAAVAFYGWPRERLTSMHIEEINILPSEDVKADMARARAGEQNDFEFRHRTASGRVRDVQVHSGVVRVGGAEYLHSIVRDITEHKELEREARSALARKAESLRRLAGGMAHRYNNLLQVVVGNLEIARQGVRPGSEPAATLGSGLAAAWEAAALGESLLVYLGQAHRPRTALDLVALIREELGAARAGACASVTLEPETTAAAPVVRADAGQLRQVLRILLDNACEAVGADGRVAVRVREVDGAAIPTMHRRPVEFEPGPGAYASFEVSDTGSGIELEAFNQLGDPFYTTKFTGRGLGLPTALGIVAEHEGCLVVESRPGEGSCFRVFLPLCEDEQLPAASLSAPAGGAWNLERKATVLLVEDEPMVLTMCTRMLTNAGAEVLAARSGREALALARERGDAITCVVCDLAMPGMDGWETLAALRELRPGLPAVVTSGLEPDDPARRAHTDVSHRFLAKPYRIEDLIAAVAAAAGERESRGA